ncbi:hypothetical protein [Phaffia rhodozyma]|uniref:Uncharacterized protein n=1 Tax=Phaffia rhodozyma TaxID=264483 RepID=A0A0F7SGL2_PHARH|nr:hypothetical protein [Phaffia rhodozyma]
MSLSFKQINILRAARLIRSSGSGPSAYPSACFVCLKRSQSSSPFSKALIVELEPKRTSVPNSKDGSISDESSSGLSSPPPVPPSKPPPPRISHYSTTSTVSTLCKSLIVSSKDARAGAGFLTGFVKNPYPLELKYEEYPDGGPSPQEWALIQEFMQEQDEERSLHANPPAILIDSPKSSDPHSRNSKLRTFTLPTIVNWTTRQVFYGPYIYSQVEQMIKDMQIEQTERFAAEAKYDAYLRSQGRRPPSRKKPETDRIKWWEVGLLAIGSYVALDWFYQVWMVKDE